VCCPAGASVCWKTPQYPASGGYTYSRSIATAPSASTTVPDASVVPSAPILCVKSVNATTFASGTPCPVIASVTVIVSDVAAAGATVAASGRSGGFGGAYSTTGTNRTGESPRLTMSTVAGSTSTSRGPSSRVVSTTRTERPSAASSAAASEAPVLRTGGSCLSIAAAAPSKFIVPSRGSRM
jgi:hypothetical protein